MIPLHHVPSARGAELALLAHTYSWLWALGFSCQDSRQSIGTAAFLQGQRAWALWEQACRARGSGQRMSRWEHKPLHALREHKPPHALSLLYVARKSCLQCLRAFTMDTLAEWLRRRPAKPMGSTRAGSNPAGVAFSCCCRSGVTRPASQVLRSVVLFKHARGLASLPGSAKRQESALRLEPHHPEQLMHGLLKGHCQPDSCLRALCNWSYGVTVSTLDSESSDRGSNPRRTFLSMRSSCYFLRFRCKAATKIHLARIELATFSV